ncbi:hypothetical protein SNK04_013809 [Fusarium graminearum]
MAGFSFVRAGGQQQRGDQSKGMASHNGCSSCARHPGWVLAACSAFSAALARRWLSAAAAWARSAAAAAAAFCRAASSIDAWVWRFTSCSSWPQALAARRFSSASAWALSRAFSAAAIAAWSFLAR